MPAASLLEPGNRWNGLIGAVGTYSKRRRADAALGARFFALRRHRRELARVEGYGTAIVAHCCRRASEARLPGAARSITAVARLGIETDEGTITADAAIVTLPSNLIAEEAVRFMPALPEKIEAAAGLPLGLADKLFLSLDHAEEFEKDTPPLRPHRSERHGRVSFSALRPAADRGVFRRVARGANWKPVAKLRSWTSRSAN